jgi:hypothetical protein
MTSQSLELYFAGKTDVELVETRFEGGWTKGPLVAIRGKTIGAFKNVGTFQWTSAVRAFCVLCVKSVIAAQQKNPVAGQLAGVKSSLAASLDYALSKQPAWLREVCGSDPHGNAYMRKLIVRTNPERKRPGPVVLGLNERLMSVNDIKIFRDHQRLASTEDLQDLLSAITTEGDDIRPVDFMLGLLGRVA